ncbi:MAG: hypothetical protein PHH93_00880 [Prolixibacteraceae bacterium]|nr:hypothetical protein [Prolixibacteraceae bacterium]
MKLRIHHFFDIIRDLGNNKEFVMHPYMHSYHIVAEKIIENPYLELKMVTGADAVCNGCIHLRDSRCDDTITHRSDFSGKEDFNNYLDRRIMNICKVRESDIITPAVLCRISDIYINNIFYIYQGNDPEHTLQRKNSVIRGIRVYMEMHQLSDVK